MKNAIHKEILMKCDYLNCSCIIENYQDIVMKGYFNNDKDYIINSIYCSVKCFENDNIKKNE